MFSPEGEELGFTDVGDSLLGEYSVFVDDIEYTVLAKVEEALAA